MSVNTSRSLVLVPEIVDIYKLPVVPALNVVCVIINLHHVDCDQFVAGGGYVSVSACAVVSLFVKWYGGKRFMVSVKNYVDDNEYKIIGLPFYDAIEYNNAFVAAMTKLYAD